jgi:hypothetical protein
LRADDAGERERDQDDAPAAASIQKVWTCERMRTDADPDAVNLDARGALRLHVAADRVDGLTIPTFRPSVRTASSTCASTLTPTAGAFPGRDVRQTAARSACM